MEILLLAFITCICYLILLFKFFNPRHVLYFDKWVDLIATAGMPLLFLGTFSGMATAILSGLMLSVSLWFLRTFVIHPEPPKWALKYNERTHRTPEKSVN